MGSALPYDNTHEPPRIVFCDVCDRKFKQYPDKVNTCTDCLQNPNIAKQRRRQRTNVAFLFET